LESYLLLKSVPQEEICKGHLVLNEVYKRYLKYPSADCKSCLIEEEIARISDIFLKRR
jgi:hypothetical protein